MSPFYGRKKVFVRDSEIETFGARFFADQLASPLIMHSLLSFSFPSLAHMRRKLARGEVVYYNGYQRSTDS